MAQRVNVVLIDDLDGSDAAETVRFGLDGTDYEIDLSAKNAERLRKAFQTYVAKGRRATARRAPSRRGRSRGATRGAASAADMRTWARANGWDVPERGRIAAEVKDAYDAAH
jgi:hypothetical protein